MEIAIIKDGVVVGINSVIDGTEVKIIKPSDKAGLNSLWDGTAFSVNPKDAELKADEQKKNEVITILTNAHAKDFRKILKDLSDANPKKP